MITRGLKYFDFLFGEAMDVSKMALVTRIEHPCEYLDDYFWCCGRIEGEGRFLDEIHTTAESYFKALRKGRFPLFRRKRRIMDFVLGRNDGIRMLASVAAYCEVLGMPLPVGTLADPGYTQAEKRVLEDFYECALSRIPMLMRKYPIKAFAYQDFRLCLFIEENYPSLIPDSREL